MDDSLFIKMAIASATLASDDVALIHLSSDNIIGIVSAGFAKLVGRKDKTIVGKSLADFIPDGVDHIHNKPIDYVAEKMDAGQFNGLTSVPFIKGDKSVIYLDLEIRRLVWPNQDRPHYCAFAKKSRKRAPKK